MPLDPQQRERIEAEAEKRGADPAKAVAEAERIAGSRDKAKPAADGAVAPATGKPTFELLLIGVLPFIRVRELRKEWLGLAESLPDDDMTCGAFAAKYGGAGSPVADAEQPA